MVDTVSVLQVKKPITNSTGNARSKYGQYLKPLIDELNSHMPRLKSLKAWPEQYKL
jgi:hypothetical protein